jgi:hypothetical protein
MQSLLTSEDTMRGIQEHDGMDAGQNALIFALGAAGGLAIGMALSRRSAPQPNVRRLGNDLRNRARDVARTLRPARMRRMAVEQDELTGLEDSVLDSFLSDELLSERGVDVGAISHGIVELSGSVWNHAEADRAVRVASGVPGVRTVVNRLEIEGEARRHSAPESGSDTLLRRTGRTGGMGRRRQGLATDPDRPNDSQHRSERALAAADRDQWSNEGYAHTNSKDTERTGNRQEPWRAEFSERELDNQDPHGQHAPVTLDAPPEEMNSDARVGEGLKDGTELHLEEADLPLKPHGDPLEENRQND